MVAAALIAGKDLKLRLRDRSFLMNGLLAPLALAFIFDLVLGGVLADQALDLEVGLVDQDRTRVSTTLTEVLEDMESEGILDLAEFGQVEEGEMAVGAGEIDALLLLSPGLEAAALSGGEYTVRVVGNVDSPTSTQIVTAIAEGFAGGIERARLSVATAFALLGGPPPDDAFVWGEEAGTAPPAFILVDVSAATRQLGPTTFFAGGMAVFFLFFTVQLGVLGLLEEDREGTLARLLAAPLTRGSVVAGKALLSFALGVIAMTVLILATGALMGAQWGPPLGVALLVVTGVLSAVGVMSLVAAVARTPEGAGNLGAIIAVVLGILGGTFFPIGQGDDLLGRLTFLAPHAWFLRGLGDISGGAPWAEALPAAGAMTVFALVFGLAGWVMLRRRLAR